MTDRLTPTRSNVVRTRARLDQVRRGATLLRKKRETLVAALFERARPAIDARRSVEDAAHAAYRGLLDAVAAEGPDALRALGWPQREVRVDLVPLEASGVHGVAMPSRPVVSRSLPARGVAIGPGDARAVAAAEAFEKLVDRLLQAAPEEVFVRRLADALLRATRLVNTIEQRVAAGLVTDLASMRRTLEEREREEHLRLQRLAARRARGRA